MQVQHKIMNKNTVRKISGPSLHIEGVITGAIKCRQGRKISAEHELKAKMEAINTSYKISTKRHNAETHELQKILKDLKNELRVSSEPYVPSSIEMNKPETRFRRNSRVKKELSIQERDNVNTVLLSESQQEKTAPNCHQPDNFSIEDNIFQREAFFAKRRRKNSSANYEKTKKIKEIVTATCEQDHAHLNAVVKDNDDTQYEGLKIYSLSSDLENSDSSHDPVTVFSRGHELDLKEIDLNQQSDITVANECKAFTLNIASNADHSACHHKKRSSSVSEETLNADNVGVVSDNTPHRAQSFRKPSCSAGNFLRVGSRERTLSLKSIPEGLPRTPHLSLAQENNFGILPLRSRRKSSQTQHHLRRPFPQGDANEPQQVIDAFEPSPGRRRSISVVNRFGDHRKRRISNHLPPLKEEKTESTTNLWTGLQNCRYLRKEDNELSIEDIFRKE